MITMENIGGRKFVLALIAIGVGAAVELTTARGLSPNMAGLLATIVGVFGVANAVITKGAMAADIRPEPLSLGLDADTVTKILDETVNNKVGALQESQDKQAEILAQIGQAVSNGNKLLKVAIFGNAPEQE